MAGNSKLATLCPNDHNSFILIDPDPAVDMVENRTLGIINLTLVALFLTYYTLWIIGLPFVEEPYLDLARKAFPIPPTVGLGVPCLTAAIMIGALGFRAYHLVQKDRRNDDR